MQPQNISISPTMGGDQISVPEQGLTFGRHENNDVVIQEGFASRYHAKLACSDDQWLLTDLGSTNGTFVNDNQLNPDSPVAISAGDILRFDEVSFEVKGEVVYDATVQVRAVTMPLVPEVTKVPPPIEEPAPASAVKPEAAQSTPKRPGAWVDADAATKEGSTMVVSVEELRRAQASAPGMDMGSVDVDNLEHPALVVTNGGSAGAILMLEADAQGGGSWLIGSDAECDIVISGEGVSGQHAKLTRAGDRWKLTEYMSTNGTFVNGEKVNVVFLNDGDLVAFGSIASIFKSGKGQSSKSGQNPQSSQRRSGMPILIAVVVIAALAAGAFYMGLIPLP